MAITTITPRVLKSNPKGSKENTNDSIQYEITYDSTRKSYNLCATICTHTNYGISFTCGATSPFGGCTLQQVNRRSKKMDLTMKNWFEVSLDKIHAVFLDKGLAGLRDISINL